MSTYADSSDRRQAAGSTLGWARRLAGGLATFAAQLTAICLIGMGALLFSGHRPMIEQSDSMAPAMHAGDVLFVKTIRAADARPGEVVTFSDPERTGKTITHRVVSVAKATPGKLDFVTRGDANTGVERWRVAPDASIGRYAFGVPRAGHLVQRAGGEAWRALVVLAAAFIAVDVLRRLWRAAPASTELERISLPEPSTTEGTR